MKRSMSRGGKRTHQICGKKKKKKGKRRNREAALGTFNASFVWREDPGVSAGRRADVEVKLNIVL